MIFNIVARSGLNFPRCSRRAVGAVARRATVRRRACAGYLQFPAACGGVL
jgi:hypothetical protein